MAHEGQPRERSAGQYTISPHAKRSAGRAKKVPDDTRPKTFGKTIAARPTGDAGRRHYRKPGAADGPAHSLALRERGLIYLTAYTSLTHSLVKEHLR
jgi:hypothetical protein